jgi:hypothetical protein
MMYIIKTMSLDYLLVLVFLIKINSGEYHHNIDVDCLLMFQIVSRCKNQLAIMMYITMTMPLMKTDETERRQPKPRGAWTVATREGTTATATCGDKPDTTIGANQASLARQSPAGS